MGKNQKPYLLDFPAVGSPDIGYLAVAQPQMPLPFEVKRVFWTYATPESIVRGRHAHFKTKQVLVAVAGRIIVHTERGNGDLQTFVLNSPTQGLYLPPCVWHTMQYSMGAVQLVMASTLFAEQDYIRSYDEFRRIWGGSDAATH